MRLLLINICDYKKISLYRCYEDDIANIAFTYVERYDIANV